MDADDPNWRAACCLSHTGFFLDIFLNLADRARYIITWLHAIKKLITSVRFTILQYSKEIVLHSLLHTCQLHKLIQEKHSDCGS
jgi:hypothetical protein